MSVDFKTTSLKDTVLSYYLFDENFDCEKDTEVNHPINHVALGCLERVEGSTNYVPSMIAEQEPVGPIQKLKSIFQPVMKKHPRPPTAAQRGNLAEYYTSLKTEKNEKLKESRLFFWQQLAGDLDLDELRNLDGNEVEAELHQWLEEHPECLAMEALYLDGRLPYLPPEIGLFTELKELGIQRCYLQELPPEMGQLTKLEYLEITSHGLRSLPPEIGNLTQLKHLDVSGSWKALNLEIPPEMSQLTQLVHLDLSHNGGLQNLSVIGALHQLEYLDIDRNGITELPLEICELTELRTLSLEGNNLTQLPAQLENLTKLELFDIEKNKIEEIDPVLESKLSSIEDYRRFSAWEMRARTMQTEPLR